MPGRRQPRAIRGIALAALLILAGYAMAFGGEAWSRRGAVALIAGNAILAAATLALGAPVRGRWRRAIAVALGGTALLLAGAMMTAVLLPPPDTADPLYLGFPLGVAVVLLGAGMLPLLVLPALFALSFDAAAFDPSRIGQLRALRAPGGGGAGPPPAAAE